MNSSISSYKVESGIQLLARLRKNVTIEKFYPVLFGSGPKQSEVIEFCSDDEITCIINDIACAALLPSCLNDTDCGVLIFNCSGHFNYSALVSCLRYKLSCEIESHDKNKEIEVLIEKALSYLFVVEVYDCNQFYTTIHNLESILLEHSNISLIIFDTLVAFYWSEQHFKITKMDVYLKKILCMVQKITREQKAILIYFRPEYFNSNKEFEEPCCENPTLEKINYRVRIIFNNNGIHTATIRTFLDVTTKRFSIQDNEIRWEKS